MTGFSIPDAMKPLYQRLRLMGFRETSSEPDEWQHPSGLQVRIAHVAGYCEIRYRPAPHRVTGYSVSKNLEIDRGIPWSQLRAPHGDSLEKFVLWLVRSAGTLESYLSAQVLVSKAPGE